MLLSILDAQNNFLREEVPSPNAIGVKPENPAQTDSSGATATPGPPAGAAGTRSHRLWLNPLLLQLLGNDDHANTSLRGSEASEAPERCVGFVGHPPRRGFVLVSFLPPRGPPPRWKSALQMRCQRRDAAIFPEESLSAGAGGTRLPQSHPALVHPFLAHPWGSPGPASGWGALPR